MNKNVLLAEWQRQVTRRGKTWLLTENVEEEARLMAEYLNNIEKWMCILTGNVGTGKTSLMLAVAEAEKKQKVWSILHAKEFALEIAEKPARILEIKNGLIAVDDVGEEPAAVMHYGSTYTPITDFFEARWQERKKTIITTNLTMKELEEKYGTRVGSRLAEMAYPIPFLGEDFRKK